MSPLECRRLIQALPAASGFLLQRAARGGAGRGTSSGQSLAFLPLEARASSSSAPFATPPSSSLSPTSPSKPSPTGSFSVARFQQLLFGVPRTVSPPPATPAPPRPSPSHGTGLVSRFLTGGAALLDAAEAGSLPCVRRWLDAGANINCRFLLNGWTPLMMASKQGKEEVVSLLLEEGASVNLVDREGRTALMIASELGYRDVVATLLSKGAKVDMADQSGDTALIWSSLRGYKQVVALLLEQGASVNMAGQDGRTALMAASRTNHTEVAALLLEKGADVNMVDKDGRTALEWSPRKGQRGFFSNMQFNLEVPARFRRKVAIATGVISLQSAKEVLLQIAVALMMFG